MISKHGHLCPSLIMIDLPSSLKNMVFNCINLSLEPAVLINSGCYYKIPCPGRLTSHRGLFGLGSGVWESELTVPAWWGSGENPRLGCRRLTSSGVFTWWQVPLPTRALISFLRTPLSGVNDPKDPAYKYYHIGD